MVNSPLQQLIGVVVANREELDALRPALELLDRLGCPYEALVASPWTAPRRLLDWVARAQGAGVQVLIVAAGGVPQLPGLIAAAGRLPVIAVPLMVGALGGADLLELTLATSPAAPVVAVQPEEPQQAALFALRLLALGDEHWQRVLEQYRVQIERDQDEMNRELRDEWLAGEGVDEADDDEDDEAFESDDAEVTPVAPVRRARMPRAGAASGIRSFVPEEEVSAGNGEDFEAEEEDAPDAALDVNDADEDFEPRLIKRGDAATQEARFADTDEPVDVRPISFDQPLDGPVVGSSAQELQPAKMPPKRAARRLGRLRIDADSPEVEIIENAVDCLLEGGVIALPTDTVYGLACDATNPAAVALLSEIKGRPAGKAISLMVDSQKQLGQIACNLTTEIRRLTEAFWPGPLTILFRKRAGNFAHVNTGEAIAVRLPDHSTPLAIMQTLGRPLAFTSAALPGAPEPMSADAVLDLHGDRLNLVLDGGALPDSTPSTVIDVTREPFKILRQGGVSLAQLSAIVGEQLDNP